MFFWLGLLMTVTGVVLFYWFLGQLLRLTIVDWLNRLSNGLLEGRDGFRHGYDEKGRLTDFMLYKLFWPLGLAVDLIALLMILLGKLIALIFWFFKALGKILWLIWRLACHIIRHIVRH